MMQQLFGNYAFAGGTIFLILGIVDYALVVYFMFPRIEAAKQARIEAGDTELASMNSVETIRLILMVMCFIVFPAVGFWLGPQLLPALGL
jgi:hypothetical protein